MLKKIIYSLLERRHFWRTADFSEIAEIYISRTLRTMAVSMVSVFVAVYLYQYGYHLAFIMLYFAIYFLLRAILVLPSAKVIARIGPKHASLISNFIYVPALLVLSQLDAYGIWALALFGIFQAASTSLYDVSHLVNFSKVKHVEHVGKEISFLYMLERIGGALSPAVGGLVALWFGPQATMIVAAVVFACAAVPLFFTPEPIQTRQHITFRHFNWQTTWRGLAANTAIGADLVVSGSVWSLYIAVVIFGTATNAVYAQLGALISVTIQATLLFSRLYGALIDRRKGGELLRYGVAFNVVSHITRPFITTPAGVLAINVANEAATTAYVMPFTKGAFDQADNLPGYRIVYMSLMGITAPLGAMAMSLTVAGLAMVLSEVHSMQISFVLAAIVAVGVAAHGFPALRRS